MTYALEARGGTWTSDLPQVPAAHAVDVDRDGLDDLLLVRPASAMLPYLGGRIDCVRGRQRERWRRVGEMGLPTADLDGDGTSDLISQSASPQVVAWSGRTGELLWHSSVSGLLLHEVQGALELLLGDNTYSAGIDPPLLRTHADLNGDGTPDVFVHKGSGSSAGSVLRSPLAALSGRTGKLLWQADVRGYTLNEVMLVDARDLDGDGRAEAILAAATDEGYPRRRSHSTGDAQLQLYVLSGSRGTVLWQTPLTAPYGQPGPPFPYQAARRIRTVPIADLR